MSKYGVRCQECGKYHEHYHIAFIGGHKVFRNCKEHCEHAQCKKLRKKESE